MIIKDEKLGEFRIEMMGTMYLVQKPSGKKKDPWTTVHHSSSINGAIDYIVRRDMAARDEELTLKQYVDKYVKAINEFKKLIK